MKRRFLLLIITISFLPTVSIALNPIPGPYYFVSDNVPGPEQFYWGGAARLEVSESVFCARPVM